MKKGIRLTTHSGGILYIRWGMEVHSIESEGDYTRILYDRYQVLVKEGVVEVAVLLGWIDE